MKTKTFATTGIILLFLVLLGMNVFAQVTLEKSYDHSLTSTRLSSTEYKYFLMDVGNQRCQIFNTDHTLWKTINIALPANYYLYDIKFVTRNLFNSDNTIELWYSAYEYTTVETGRYISGIVNENGTELVSTPGGLYAYVIKAGDEVYKLVVYAYDYTVSPGTVKSHVYALPSSSTAAAHVTTLLPDPYPNPATREIILPLPPGAAGALLQVHSAAGQRMAEVRTSGEPVYRLPVEGWPSGSYTYRVISGGSPSVAKRFVVK